MKFIFKIIKLTKFMEKFLDAIGVNRRKWYFSKMYKNANIMKITKFSLQQLNSTSFLKAKKMHRIHKTKEIIQFLQKALLILIRIQESQYARENYFK